MYDQVMLHVHISCVYLDRIILVLYTCLVFYLSRALNFICHVQVFQDTGVYGSSASQLLDLGVSEFCLCSQTQVKSKVCLRVLSWNSQRGRL